MVYFSVEIYTEIKNILAAEKSTYKNLTQTRSLNLLTPIEYCSKLINKKDPAMLQMYWTQTVHVS